MGEVPSKETKQQQQQQRRRRRNNKQQMKNCIMVGFIVSSYRTDLQQSFARFLCARKDEEKTRNSGNLYLVMLCFGEHS